MERFSNAFVARHEDTFRVYSTRWVRDPLHQWSRQWEYCYVMQELLALQNCHDGSVLSVLDAGSGITFFPYYICHAIPGTQVACCDVDESLTPLYERANKRESAQPLFVARDIRRTELGEQSRDAVYCISVLEHTHNHEEILSEFHRVLKCGGWLILTFDISRDGRDQISLSESRQLVNKLCTRFSPTDQKAVEVLLHDADLLKRDVVATVPRSEWPRHMLPPRPSLRSCIRDVLSLQRPARQGKDLTFACYTFRKS